MINLLTINICSNAKDILSLVGIILTVFKIAIPIIIIAIGMVDLGKAALSSKPEEIKKQATSLLWRFVGGVFIFFLPSLVMLLFKLIGPWGPVEAQTDYNICYSCVVHPWRGCGASQDKQDQGNYENA